MRELEEGVGPDVVDEVKPQAGNIILSTNKRGKISPRCFLDIMFLLSENHHLHPFILHPTHTYYSLLLQSAAFFPLHLKLLVKKIFVDTPKPQQGPQPLLRFHGGYSDLCFAFIPGFRGGGGDGFGCVILFFG